MPAPITRRGPLSLSLDRPCPPEPRRRAGRLSDGLGGRRTRGRAGPGSWSAGCSTTSPSSPRQGRAATTRRNGRPTAAASPLSAGSAPPTSSSCSTSRPVARRSSSAPSIDGVGLPRWSPDGKRIAFLGAVWRTATPWSTTRGLPRTATSFAAPRSRGSYVASTTSTMGAAYVDGRQHHLFVVPASGGEAKQLTDGPWDVSDFDWSPDSTRAGGGRQRGARRRPAARAATSTWSTSTRISPVLAAASC